MRGRTHWRPWAFVIVLSLSLGALFVSSDDLIVAPVAAQTDASAQLRARFVNIAWLDRSAWSWRKPCVSTTPTADSSP